MPEYGCHGKKIGLRADIRPLAHPDLRSRVAILHAQKSRGVAPDLAKGMDTVVIDQRHTFPVPASDQQDIVRTHIQMQIPRFVKGTQDLQGTADDFQTPEKFQFVMQPPDFFLQTSAAGISHDTVKRIIAGEGVNMQIKFTGNLLSHTAVDFIGAEKAFTIMCIQDFGPLLYFQGVFF